jgi:transposase
MPAWINSAQTRQLLEQAGCQWLYLPAYSPGLNPIEKLWANLKKRWRKIGGFLDALVAVSNY